MMIDDDVYQHATKAQFNMIGTAKTPNGPQTVKKEGF